MIRTKKEAFRLYESGMFGNKLRTWNSYRELFASAYEGSVTIRYKEANSRFCYYNVSQDDLIKNIDEMLKLGAREENFVFNESAPDSKLLIQGEVIQDHNFYTLFYSTTKDKMRPALKKTGQETKGLQALHLLKSNMTPSSYEDLQSLFDKYPDNIVEFSTYEMFLGCIPYRNTIIWEVRGY